MKAKNTPEITVIVCGIVLTIVVIVVGLMSSPLFSDQLEDIRSEPILSDIQPIAVDGKVDINSADVDELTQLYGIGEAKAQAIIDYRLKNGGFFDVDELIQVKGISAKIIDKNIDLIIVGPDTEDAYEFQSD